MNDDAKRGISGSTVKLVGIVTMFIDHFAAALVGRVLLSGGWTDELYYVYWIMRMIGRLGFPIFCFLLVEGFEKTRSKKKYVIRLGAFALISEIPFDLAFKARVLEFNYQNVYFTLCLGLLALCGYELLAKHRPPTVVRWLLCVLGVAMCSFWVLFQISDSFGLDDNEMPVFGALCLITVLVLAIYGWRKGLVRFESAGMNLAVLGVLMLLAELLRTDYAGLGVLTISVMYVMRNSNVRAMVGGNAVLTLFNSTEITAFFAVIPVAMYNGKRGLKLKYFFYIFYPGHLLLLWLIAWLLGMGRIPVV